MQSDQGGSVCRWFGRVVRKENDKIANRVYIWLCAGSHLLDRLRKRWIDTLKDCLKKRGLDVMQTRRMVHDRSEWRGSVRGITWGVAC